MKIIADVGDINYYIRRATEFLTSSLTALTREQRVKYFDSALGLIALAKVKTQEQSLITIEGMGPLKVADLTQTKGETEERRLKVPKVKIECTQDVCDSGKCAVKSICPGISVLGAAKEIYGKNDEVDKQEQAKEVRCSSDCVQEKCVSGDVPDTERSDESKGQVPEETQSWPQATSKNAT